MNKIMIIVLIAVAFATAIFSCDNTNQEEVQKEATTQRKPKLDIYEDSELAKLMREMHESMKEVRKSIKNEGQPLTIKDYSVMMSAEPTDPNVQEPKFEGYAKSFLNQAAQFNNAEKEKAMLFNASVDACIACHQSYCTGPIETIGKLKIKVED